MNEKPGCRECQMKRVHWTTCSLNTMKGGPGSPVLDSERKDFGRMAQAIAESLGRTRLTDNKVVARPTIDHYWREDHYAD